MNIFPQIEVQISKVLKRPAAVYIPTCISVSGPISLIPEKRSFVDPLTSITSNCLGSYKMGALIAINSVVGPLHMAQK